MKPAQVQSCRYPGIYTQPLLQYPTLPFALGVTHTSCARKGVKRTLLWVVLNSQRLLWSTLIFCWPKKAGYGCSLPQRSISTVAKISMQLSVDLHPESYCSSQYFCTGNCRAPCITSTGPVFKHGSQRCAITDCHAHCLKTCHSEYKCMKVQHLSGFQTHKV